MKKFAIFAFRGDAMCFVHVLLNALDMKQKGYDVKIIIEGEAVKLVGNMEANPLFQKAKSLIDCICRACSAKLGVLEYNEESGIPMCDDMSGHPSMERYIKDGYVIITM